MGMSEDTNETKAKPHFQWAGGPLGLGDPDDLRLRKVEKDIILPKRMKEEASKRCEDTFKVFLDCSKREGLMVVFNCQKENELNNECLLRWLKDPEFEKEITNKYLEARSHFRRTGETLEKFERKKARVDSKDISIVQLTLYSSDDSHQMQL